ncbi:MAG: phosphoglycerate dehydrogenase [Phycisphaerae bacterium]
MKILIADKFEQSGIDRLRGLASTLEVDAGLKGDALVDKMRGFDPNVLVVRSTKVPKDVIDAGKSLQMILRAGSGVDNIDVPSASERGVSVANCPGMNAVAVAELTLGLILALDRHIPDNVIDFRKGEWSKKKYGAAALGLKGRTLGIIGAGQIGTEVARRAVACEMKVIYTHLGRSRGLVDFPSCRRTEMEELLREADVVTIHIPGGDSTKALLDAKNLALLKPTAFLINTSRASVIDENALANLLKTGKLRGAAIDVFNNEPAGADGEPIDSPLRDVPNLYVTHHIGASTQQAQEAVADEAVRIVAEFKATNRVLNCVNLNESPPQSLLVVKLRNKPGGLAHVFQVISTAGINVEEMDHVIFDGGKTACAHIRVTPSPDAALVEKIRTGHDNVLGVELIASA